LNGTGRRWTGFGDIVCHERNGVRTNTIDSSNRELNKEITACVKCRLSEGRIHAVPGEGPVPSPILMIGEAPGQKEDEVGRPFIGRAGSVLQELLTSIGLTREDVYITSIIKCRPPGNRDPKDDEIATCSPYLGRQIALLKPSVIVSMGRLSTREMCRRFGIEEGRISEMHGRVIPVHAPHGPVLIFPVYHPAVITHNPNLRQILFEDFAGLRKLLHNHFR
jgi:uracil-DNA glycosylase family 4